MAIFRKTFTDPTKLRNELKLHKKSARFGFSPKVLGTDTLTFIEYDDIQEMNVDDMFGEEIPLNVMNAIWGALHILYYICKIEYHDVWPRNFIWKDGRIWVVDFEDAHIVNNNSPSQYTKQIFEIGRIDNWNPEFA